MIATLSLLGTIYTSRIALAGSNVDLHCSCARILLDHNTREANETEVTLPFLFQSKRHCHVLERVSSPDP